MRPVVGSAIATGLVLLVSQSGAAAGADQGAQLAAACASCHRLDGRDKGIAPIVGLDEEKLLAAMQAFKSGERPSQIMHVMSLSLSDEEIATVVRYLAAQGKETTQP
jgi:cytochrome subunit of sulfide dehydrogenase